MSSVSTPVRRVQRVRHELKRRELVVRSVEALSPGFTRVTLAGDSLADFVSASFDDHVKFILDGPGGEPVRRDYTPRAFDTTAGTLVIEFALHGHGGASEWARQARPGQRVTVGGPRGSMVIPMDYAWHLLAGDATALPAMHRRLEELPAGSRVIVVGQVAEEDRRSFDARPGLDVQWVAGPEDLVAALRALDLPAGEGFAWAAGEAATMARVRQVLVEEKQHPREAMRVAAYWKLGASEHHENLE